ncbi:hypothetical protein RvY_14495 [Ramazzottius varieornatus]|uniref:Palmitoyltransferase n=1 Tax=Ramazzottius varieornatus TaxID=947166 RepID=A0A1D1VRL9_RAMVA|nr:hypothetical protein RvY_14495 [Ramazzottius varieornatus]
MLQPEVRPFTATNKNMDAKLRKWPYRKLKDAAHFLWNRLKIRRVPLGSRTDLTLDYALDIVLEPCFRLIDKGYLNHLGPVMVVLVIVLTLSIIAILLLVMLPWYLQYRNILLVVWHFPVATYLFFSISFHYIQGLRTPPGYPPPAQYSSANQIQPLCSKCQGLKPPRTHHCTICNRCILRMDHHCPWLNSCVGHYNHRYFFSFMLYMWFGSAYLCIFVYPEFKELYYLPVNHPEVYSMMQNASSSGTVYVPENPVHRLHRRSVIYMFLLSGAASISVFCLLMWHVTLISCGETSIEAHINKKETKRLAAQGRKYDNPYDFGFWGNWRNALGVSHNNFRWRHLLWFSVHQPEGNGVQWETSVHEHC